MTYFEIALNFHQCNDYENALLYYDKALREHPRDFQILSNQGAVFQKLRRFEDALVSYNSAIALTQDHAVIFNNRGVSLQELHRLDESIADFDRAIALNPSYPQAYVNRGFVHHLRNHFSLAIADYKKAIVLVPTFAAAHFNLSLSQLAIGDYAHGWLNYEWRWRAVPDTPARVFPEHQPLWTGQDLLDKTIFLYAEQGLGDTLQFCRYIELVQRRGAEIILEAPRELASLLSQMQGVKRLIQTGDEVGRFDYQCPLMSLPLAFRTELDSIPCPMGYLRADAVKSAHWRQKLSAHQRFKVGLVWSGGFRHDQPKLWGLNDRRNLPIDFLRSLNKVDADFFSLQKGEAAEAELLVRTADASLGLNVYACAGDLHDFSDTAALIENLDLVISVDTSTAHLAAALGKPVWILNRFDACWRWLSDRSDSPWYSSVRLYRQTREGDWDSLMGTLVDDLSQWVSHQIST